MGKGTVEFAPQNYSCDLPANPYATCIKKLIERDHIEVT